MIVICNLGDHKLLHSLTTEFMMLMGDNRRNFWVHFFLNIYQNMRVFGGQTQNRGFWWTYSLETGMLFVYICYWRLPDGFHIFFTLHLFAFLICRFHYTGSISQQVKDNSKFHLTLIIYNFNYCIWIILDFLDVWPTIVWCL